MFSSANTDMKLKCRRTIVDFSRKVCILLKRENIALKRRALPNTFRSTNGTASKIKVFPLTCWKEGMYPLVFINAVLDSSNNGKEE